MSGRRSDECGLLPHSAFLKARMQWPMLLRIKCGHQQQPESKMSVALKMFLIYAIGGPIILCITMRIFGAEVALWQPAAATILAAFCTLVLPSP